MDVAPVGVAFGRHLETPADTDFEELCFPPGIVVVHVECGLAGLTDVLVVWLFPGLFVSGVVLGTCCLLSPLSVSWSRTLNLLSCPAMLLLKNPY